MENKQIKGISIQRVNMVMLIVSALLFIVVIYTTIQIAQEYEENLRTTKDYIDWEKAAHQIHVGSDILTEQSRLFTQNHKKENADKYFEELHITRSREKALNSIMRNNMDAADISRLEEALAESNELSQREIYAMRLVAEANHMDLDAFHPGMRNVELSDADRRLDAAGKIEKARRLMFNEDYARTKSEIMASLNKFLEQNLERTNARQQAQSQKLGDVLQEQRIVLIFLCLLNLLTFAMIIVLIVKPLQVYMKCIRDDKMIELVGAYEFKNLALTYNDIFAMKMQNDKMLKHKAEHDPLTGLLNRGAFESLKRLLEAASDPIGLMLVDVDKFKQINDTYGHAVGDKILMKVAGLLRGAFRSEDFCIRLGGDEFAVVIKGIMPDIEDIICEKVNKINKILTHPEDDLPKESISVGVAISTSGFNNDLYINADKALYVVKAKGRCGCEFYHHISDDKIDATPKTA